MLAVTVGTKRTENPPVSPGERIPAGPVSSIPRIWMLGFPAPPWLGRVKLALSAPKVSSGATISVSPVLA